jgi:drug/metabolite transporter (DMT)-like permease
VSVVVPFDYAQLLWAVLFGWLLFADQAAASTWAGAAIIVGSGLYTVYREHKIGRDRAKMEAEAAAG